MFKKVCAAVAILGLIGSPVAFATNQYRQTQRLRVAEKVVQFSDTLRVVGIPVSQTGAEYHWQAQPQPQVQAQQPCLSDQDVQKLVTAIVQALRQEFGTQPQPQPQPQPNPTPVAPPPVDPVISKAETIITNKCASCHGVSSHGGNFDFVADGKVVLKDLEGGLPPSDIAWLMYDTTFHGSMPKGQSALSDEEVKQLQDYAVLLTRQERSSKKGN